MANFSATQSFQTQGLCEKIISTDTSDYVGNTEGYTEDDIEYRRWTFRNSSGTIIKTFETDNKTIRSCDCAISLLTLNISIELLVRFDNNQSFGVQNTLLLACLGL